MGRLRVPAAVLAAVMWTASPAWSGPIFYDNLASFLAAASPSLTEDFDSAPWVDGANPTPIVANGLTWPGLDGILTTDGGGLGGTRALRFDTVGGEFVQLPEFGAGTAVGGMAIGLWIQSGGPVDVNFYRGPLSGGPYLLTDTVTVSGGDWRFFGVTWDDPAWFVVLRLEAPIGGSGQTVHIDDLRYGASTAVPEPASAVLLLLGVVAMAVLRRHRAVARALR